MKYIKKMKEMKKIFTITIVIYFFVVTIQAQNTDPRIENLELKLDSLSTEIPVFLSL